MFAYLPSLRSHTYHFISNCSAEGSLLLWNKSKPTHKSTALSDVCRYQSEHLCLITWKTAQWPAECDCPSLFRNCISSVVDITIDCLLPMKLSIENWALVKNMNFYLDPREMHVKSHQISQQALTVVQDVRQYRLLCVITGLIEVVTASSLQPQGVEKWRVQTVIHYVANYRNMPLA